jgi:hypothetical protein
MFFKLSKLASYVIASQTVPTKNAIARKPVRIARALLKNPILLRLITHSLVYKKTPLKVYVRVY